MDILSEENTQIDRLLGHGGFFKSAGAGQRFLAAALGAPVSVMESAGEGGAWGIALLAAFSTAHSDGEKLEDYLENRVFAGNTGTKAEPQPDDSNSFAEYINRYKQGLGIAQSAVKCME